MLTRQLPGGRVHRHALIRGRPKGGVFRQTQFSLFQNVDEGTEGFEVKFYLKFDRSSDHEGGGPLAEQPAFEIEGPERVVSASDLRAGLVPALERISFRAEADRVPFPAGLGYGPVWTGAPSVRVSLTGTGGYQFRVQAEGSLRWLQSWGDVAENADAGTFAIECEIPFEGVWIETDDPARKQAVIASYRSVFEGHPFDVDHDEMRDGFVLRAGP